MMKNLFILAILCLLASASPVSAENYFSLRTETTTPEDGKLRIPPSLVGTYCPMYATANFEGYLDHWYVEFRHPASVSFIEEDTCSGMNLPYITINGTDSVYTPILTVNYRSISINNDTTLDAFSATSIRNGYWDPDGDGQYESYGTVKWATDYYDEMFTFLMSVNENCLEGDIIITGTLTSTSDNRDITLLNNAPFNETIHYWVGYRPGDISGDDIINIGDLAMLQTLLLQGPGDLDQFQLAAADVNGDGVLNISDVTALSDILLGVNGLEDEQLQ